MLKSLHRGPKGGGSGPPPPPPGSATVLYSSPQVLHRLWSSPTSLSSEKPFYRNRSSLLVGPFPMQVHSTGSRHSFSPVLPTCLPVCLPAYTYLPTYLPVCLPARLPACPPTCLPARLPACPPAYLPTCLPPTYLPTYLPAYLPTFLPTYLPVAGDLFSYGGKDIVFSQYSPVWTVQRKIAHTAIR